ncbi:Acyl transferase/acyl hydrolase/lysophospholipase [Penicillium italicum]|uniref:Acyl transferase/acyl hydrolase/lysophospholipase n=1 Tax=Penicillium italicum TaxID=40296 RepID=A0A0A2LDZ8_PENIT|nr:Acyl transferase/acyl hydrolase/lysophospholipase [Penicillium italicum]
MELPARRRASQPLRILSLDGGGIRGISSLLILERIMEGIRDAHQLDRVPRPCEYFDLIGGTSTGGIIAIMLGRLGMTVDECIRAYRKVAERAFTPKAHAIIPARLNGAFSAHALEEAIKQTVTEFCTNRECVNRRRNGLSTTRVVFAITKANLDAGPTLFRTYDKSNALDGCAIWEVARATSAATTFFKSIKVGRDKIEYIDAGFGYNNPCDKLIAEAKEVFPGRSDLQILSIGTGLGDAVSIKNSRLSIIEAMKKMTTSSSRVAASLSDQYGKNGQYFRFNVEHGLEDITLSDWEQASKISANTSNYLCEKSKEIEKFVKTFGARDGQHEPGFHRFVNVPIVSPV